MSLLDDIRADQAAVDERVERLITVMELQAVDAIETTHTCLPLVGAVTGVDNSTKLFQLSWDNHWEMDQVFHEVDDSLRENNASASIALVPSIFDSNAPGMEEQPAILIMARTRGWTRAIVIPYLITDRGTVEWSERIIQEGFNGGPLSVPTTN